MRFTVRAFWAAAFLAAAFAVNTGQHTNNVLSTSGMEDWTSLLLDDKYNALSQTLARVLEKNEEMERRLNEVSLQSAECMNRLSNSDRVDNRHLQSEELTVLKNELEQTKADLAEHESKAEQSLVGITHTTFELEELKTIVRNLRTSFKKRIQNNKRSTRSVREDLVAATAQIQSNTDGIKTTMATTIGDLSTQMSVMKTGLEQASSTVFQLSEVVDKTAQEVQQMSETGGITPSSASTTTVILSTIEKMKASIQGLEAKVATMTSQFDPSNPSNDPALSVFVASLAGELNETKLQIEGLETRVSGVETSVGGLGTTVDKTWNATITCDANVAALASKVEELDPSALSEDRVLELELAVATLVNESMWLKVTVEDNSYDIGELFMLVEGYLATVNSTACNGTGCEASSDIATQVAILQDAVFNNGTSRLEVLGLAISETQGKVSTLASTTNLRFDEIIVALEGILAASNITDVTGLGTALNVSAEFSAELSELRLSVKNCSDRIEDNTARIEDLGSDLTLLAVSHEEGLNRTEEAIQGLRLTVDEVINATSDCCSSTGVANVTDGSPAATNGTNSSMASLDLTSRVAALESALFTDGSNRLEVLEGAFTTLEAAVNDTLELFFQDLVYDLTIVANSQDELANRTEGAIQSLQLALTEVINASSDCCSNLSSTNTSNSNTTASDVTNSSQGLHVLTERVTALESSLFTDGSNRLEVLAGAVATLEAGAIETNQRIVDVIDALDILTIAANITNVTGLGSALEVFTELSELRLGVQNVTAGLEANTARIEDLENDLAEVASAHGILALDVHSNGKSLDNITVNLTALTHTMVKNQQLTDANFETLFEVSRETREMTENLKLEFSSYVNATDQVISNIQASLNSSDKDVFVASSTQGSATDTQAMKQAIGETQARLALLTSVVNTHATNISDSAAQVEELNALVADHTSQLEDLMGLPEKVSGSYTKLWAVEANLIADISKISSNVESLVEKVDAGKAEVTTLSGQVASLSIPDLSKFACISDESTDRDIVFKGCNVHIVNGADETDSTNSAGNLIIGYNEIERGCPNECDRRGSHNLVLGTSNSYTSYGGFVTGEQNSIDEPYLKAGGSWAK